MKPVIFLLSGLIFLLNSCVSHKSSKPATPDFGPNVFVFDPSMSMDSIQSKVDEIFQQQEYSQFGDGRYAFLFHPGEYNLDVNVGFYTEALGLGSSPDDVLIKGLVHSEADWMKGNATCTFWRSVAGIAVEPKDGMNRWATSQATPFRRMHIKGNMVLDDGGWSSGGFIADSKIDSTISSGSQQQYFTRNATIGKWRGGNWNMVFAGVTNPPSGTWPDKPYTVIPKIPVVREKPFLMVDKSGNYLVHVPELKRDSTIGISWASGNTPGTSLPLEEFYIATVDKDNAATMNEALNSGKHLLITPGIYRLDESIKVKKPGTIVLGIGLPSLVPVNGTPAIEAADVDGIKIGGVLSEASDVNSTNLVVIGESGSNKSHEKDPICLWDIFCRAGGSFNGTTDCFLTINSSDVIGDHFWLWRADHGKGAGWNSNRNANGLIVNGNNVTVYGLFVEHTQEYQTLWKGENGRVYFYQCEMPYDPPAQELWMHDGKKGYPGYKVDDSVNTHEAWGMGVYSVLRNPSVAADNGFEASNKPGIKMHNLLTFKIRGDINHVINEIGDKAPARVVKFPE